MTTNIIDLESALRLREAGDCVGHLLTMAAIITAGQATTCDGTQALRLDFLGSFYMGLANKAPAEFRKGSTNPVRIIDEGAGVLPCDVEAQS